MRPRGDVVKPSAPTGRCRLSLMAIPELRAALGRGLAIGNLRQLVGTPNARQSRWAQLAASTSPWKRLAAFASGELASK